MSVTPNGREAAFICTAHYAGHVEIVPTAPGSEAKTYPPIPLQGCLAGTVHDHWDDPKLIEEVKGRVQSAIRDWLETERTDISDFEALHKNLALLRSLDGDEPAALVPPTPCKGCCAKKERPNYVGKLVFIEFPLGSEAQYDSGEFIVVVQSVDSLYAIKTDSCLVGVHVGRIPFVAGEEQITILSVCEDDEFIREFIERLDDMDTEDYEPEECDAAETVSRQLQRMLAVKASPLDRLFKATDEFFDRLGMGGMKHSEFREVSTCS
jgi:hypothetical protein